MRKMFDLNVSSSQPFEMLKWDSNLSMSKKSAIYEENGASQVEKTTVPPIKLTVIPFNQSDIISELHPEKHKTLLGFVDRFGGLCQLICNRILLDDLLGNGENLNSIKNHITIERMDEEKIKKSHLLDVYSIFRKAIAFLFGIYPDNIFSCFDQWKLVKTSKGHLRKVNSKILEKGLNDIREGEILKLEVFRKGILSFSGHSLLIKKMSKKNYIFFDPNSGEHRDLSFCQLSKKINEQLKKWNGTDIYLTKGKCFLKRL